MRLLKISEVRGSERYILISENFLEIVAAETMAGERSAKLGGRMLILYSR